MTVSLPGVKAVVTDIEGTTSSIDFVHEVLFPYAAAALPEFLRRHSDEAAIRPLLDDVREEAREPDADVERLAAILLQWIAEDRKVTPLKALQGHVWQHGYETGAFRGHIYGDAAEKLREWHARGVLLHVYSSGSVKAQQLLFGYSEAGDLRALFAGWFDTRTGAKKEPASYRRIGEAIGMAPDAVLFLSDSIAEVDAAAAAGMRTVQVCRERGLPTGKHPRVHDFHEILI